jgi:hypothetical protein
VVVQVVSFINSKIMLLELIKAKHNVRKNWRANFILF